MFCNSDTDYVLHMRFNPPTHVHFQIGEEMLLDPYVDAPEASGASEVHLPKLYMLR